MEPKIVERQEIILAGIVECSGRVEDLDIGRIWERFVSIEEGIEFPVEGVGYEVHIETGTEPRMHYCLTGVEVSALGALPPEVFVKVLPPCTYAVFTHRVVEGYETLYARIREWLDLTQHERNTDFDFQLYDVRFKGMDDPESLQDVYIPLKL